MRIFELFLISGSILSLIISWGLFYENCNLTRYVVNILNDNIRLINEAVELQMDKMQLMNQIIVLQDADKNPKLLLEEIEKQSNDETPTSI